MRVFPFILYLILIAFHQTITRDVTALWGVSINLTALIVIIVAIHKSEMTTVWFGFLAGLTMAAGVPDRMGWIALMAAVLGTLACHMTTRLNLESLYSRLLLVLGGVLFFNLFSLIIYRYDDFVQLAVTDALGGAVYTSVLGWLFFLVKERRLTVQKVKSIF